MAYRGLAKPSVKSLIWMLDLGQLLDLDVWLGSNPWFGCLTGVNSLIWMQNWGYTLIRMLDWVQLIDLDAWLVSTTSFGCWTGAYTLIWILDLVQLLDLDVKPWPTPIFKYLTGFNSIWMLDWCQFLYLDACVRPSNILGHGIMKGKVTSSPHHLYFTEILEKCLVPILWSWTDSRVTLVGTNNPAPTRDWTWD